MDYQKNYVYPNQIPTQNDTQVQNQTQPTYIQHQPQLSQPVMPTYQPTSPSQNLYPQPTLPNPTLPVEQSYIENILRLNKGKIGTFYFTYTDSQEWRDRVYKGVIEAAGRDHLIISDPKTGKRYLFQMIYFDWAEFDEEIIYAYPYR